MSSRRKPATHRCRSACANGALLFGRVGPDGMLNSVAELAQNAVRNIHWVLRDEKYADPFGADEAGNLFNFVNESVWSVVEKQVRFVEKEHHFRLVRITDLWELLTPAAIRVCACVCV